MNRSFLSLFQKPLFKLRTLEDRFFLTFTALFFLSIVSMLVVSFQISIQTVTANNTENNRILLNQLIAQIDSYMASMDNVSRILAEDPYSIDFLHSTQITPETIQQVQERLNLTLRVRDDVSGIVLIRPDGTMVHGDSQTSLASWVSIQNRPWYQWAAQDPGRTFISPSYVQNLYENRYAWVVSLTRGIPAENRNGNGVLMVDMKFTRIQELSTALVNGKQGYTFILDQEGNYIYHPTLQLIYSGIKSEPLDQLREILPLLDSNANPQLAEWINGDLQYLLGRSQHSGWTVVSVSSQRELMEDWQVAQVIFAIIGLVIFLVIGLISNVMAQSITKPVHQLQKVMRSVETGEFTKAGDIAGTDEIKELAREYDLMVARIAELVTANAKEQELKRKSDLKALQAQINPHFLYNTLDSIIWMGEMGQNEDLVVMTSALARLFRISISRGKELIPLKDEVNHVLSYLTIQEMRYKDKFRYTIDVPETLTSCKVLKITLQPLVENAIYHGVRDLKDEGLIQIKAWEQDDSIIMEVKDNGNGMDDEELLDLRNKLDQPFEDNWDDALYGHSHSSGTGVRNVHQRITLYFGTQYGLSLFSIPDEGTTIRVHLPKNFQEDRE